MFWVYTNYHYTPMTTNYSTLRAHFFYRWTNFHKMPHLKSFIELKTPYTLMKTWKITSFSGRTTGIEPATDGVTVHCLTTWLRPPDTYTWGYQIWVPLSSHFFISLFFKRVTWFEHATSNLEGWHSTIELYPHTYIITKDINLSRDFHKNFMKRIHLFSM